ncbi:hypothetical protein N9V90_00910 [Endozoicomonas sp.]|nr:hypothetical protein [Endozoicomonas sp.]
MTYSGRVVALLALIGCAFLAQANDSYRYACHLEKERRIIEVDYLKRESAVPCEVKYTKHGKEETLWTATYQAGYCEEKAEELVNTLTQAGWVCKKMGNESSQNRPFLGEQPNGRLNY